MNRTCEAGLERQQFGDSRVFNVSKAKRETLHNLCDFLSNTTLQAQGRRIHHASQGAGRNRTLVVTMERSNMPALPGTNSVGGVHAFDDSPFDVHSHAIASHNVAGTPPKRARTANQAAAEAAMLRAALHESALMVKKPPAGPGSMAPRNLYDDNVSCNLTNRAQTNQTTAANSKRSRPAVKSNHAGPIWLDGLDDDSDDDEAWLYESAMKLPSVATKTTTPNVLELSDSSDDDGDSLSPRLVLDDDSDDDEAWLYESAMKLPSVATKTTTPNVLELSDSSDDDGDSLSRKTAATRVAPLAKARSISFDDDKQVENVIDLTEEDASPRASAATYTPTTHQQQPKLTIYIDDRERNKNATPRMLRMELTRMLTTGLLRRVWPSSLPAPQIEERKLARGDFAFESTLGSSTFNFPVAIERKTIADIVQRSVHQDHWKQLCQMRDGFELCVFLLEGDMRTAIQHTAYGAQNHEDTMSPMTHKIDDADSLIRFVGRALLTTPSFRLVMTEHEQGSLQAVAAFGLMSMFHYIVGKTPLSTPPKKLMSQASARQELKDRLQNGGIPWQVSKLVSDEVGSIVQMSRLYESARDEECRDVLLTPLLGDVIREVSPLRGTAEHWSAAVHRVFYSPHSDVGVGRKALHDFQDIVTDHASLLANVHSAMSAEDALDKTLNLPDKVTASLSRSVNIELPELLEDCFPKPEDGEDTIYNVNVVRDESDIAKVTMHTCAGGFRSASLCIFLFDGEEIISRIQDKIKTYPAHFVEIARSAAEDLHKACSGDDDRSQRILLIRGLGNALTKAAKKAGYRSELPVLVDMFQAQLSLAHEMVVLHAARLNDDREMILQQLAMACYHFQPLLFKADK
ncbi:hypothetical protein MPSEU_000976400 [Mayamaea pseudoterrestris]|nr:hypothetical protein MPSEU_000976400 [Mayamaea pseudoterrestris]